MKIVRQLPSSGTCGQCCVATLAGISLAEAVEVFGHGRRGGTCTWEVLRALRQLGFQTGSGMRSTDDVRPSHYRGKRGRHLLPPLAICFIYYTATAEEHWVVVRDGHFYCPTDGRDPKWSDKNVQVRAYIQVHHPLPSQGRIRQGIEVMRVAATPPGPVTGSSGMRYTFDFGAGDAGRRRRPGPGKRRQG